MSNAANALDRLIAIMAALRHPGKGCPWDLEQTFATIAPHTIEEAYEVADAIQKHDMEALKDELGDLLFQVVYHARMAQEAGTFTVADVAEAISDKLVRRHPHVFGSAVVADAEAQTRAWEDQKAEERRALGGRAAGSALDGVIAGLPALTRGVKLQRRAARVGFDWDDAKGVLAKLREEIEELTEAIEAKDEARAADELGDLLFTGVNLARKLGVDPESALRGANAKFESRFRRMEKLLAEKGLRCEAATLDQMEAAWGEAKRGDKAVG
ncbi:MAG: nucleoside triphosphate pyrophosphohydrolase [Rhodospirillales bacterium]|nr:nucleoside triphosphate pyrophosphohydrolase [Rhodospirillales bacterium]